MERKTERGRRGEGKEERRNRVERNALYTPASFHADKTDPLFSDSCMGALCPLWNFRCPRRYLRHAELYYHSDLAAI